MKTLNIDFGDFEKYVVYRERADHIDATSPMMGTAIHAAPGIRIGLHFDNGYGASIIKLVGSYGYDDDKWELAVTKKASDENWNLTYDTPITDDVLEYLTDSEVLEILKQIRDLA